MNNERYSQAQVLCGLREVWLDRIGMPATFEADTRIDMYVKTHGFGDECDLDVVCRGAEQLFGFTCSDKEWADLFGLEIAKRNHREWEQSIAPYLTFGAMANFIADRAPVVASFESITMLGRPCASAGIFTGIEKVAEKVIGERRFAPSSRIPDVIRGNDLERFWTQLRWMTEDTVPELSGFWRGVTSYALLFGLLVISLGIIGAKITSELYLLVLSPVVAVAVYLLARFYKRLANPLPSHIASFRDLSVLIAESRSKAA
ncbi:MAG: hypothetical protein QM703_26405 [Gemmatales bacterium]